MHRYLLKPYNLTKFLICCLFGASIACSFRSEDTEKEKEYLLHVLGAMLSMKYLENQTLLLKIPWMRL